MRIRLAHLIFASVIFISPLALHADSLMYIDESGSIFFVDDILQIPPQYRWQLEAKKKPQTEIDPKTIKKYEKDIQKKKKKKTKEELKKKKLEEVEKKKRAKEIEREKKLVEKEAKKNKKH